MADRDDTVQDVEDSIRRAELERLLADRITLSLGALCERLSQGDRADRERGSFRDDLTHSIAEAIRSAVRPLEQRIEAPEEGDRGILTTDDLRPS